MCQDLRLLWNCFFGSGDYPSRPCRTDKKKKKTKHGVLQPRNERSRVVKWRGLAELKAGPVNQSNVFDRSSGFRSVNAKNLLVTKKDIAMLSSFSRSARRAHSEELGKKLSWQTIEGSDRHGITSAVAISNSGQLRDRSVTSCTSRIVSMEAESARLSTVAESAIAPEGPRCVSKSATPPASGSPVRSPTVAPVPSAPALIKRPASRSKTPILSLSRPSPRPSSPSSIQSQEFDWIVQSRKKRTSSTGSAPRKSPDIKKSSPQPATVRSNPPHTTENFVFNDLGDDLTEKFLCTSSAFFALKVLKKGRHSNPAFAFDWKMVKLPAQRQPPKITPDIQDQARRILRQEINPPTADERMNEPWGWLRGTRILAADGFDPVNVEVSDLDDSLHVYMGLCPRDGDEPLWLETIDLGAVVDGNEWLLSTGPGSTQSSFALSALYRMNMIEPWFVFPASPKYSTTYSHETNGDAPAYHFWTPKRTIITAPPSPVPQSLPEPNVNDEDDPTTYTFYSDQFQAEINAHGVSHVLSEAVWWLPKAVTWLRQPWDASLTREEARKRPEYVELPPQEEDLSIAEKVGLLAINSKDFGTVHAAVRWPVFWDDDPEYDLDALFEGDPVLAQGEAETPAQADATFEEVVDPALQGQEAVADEQSDVAAAQYQDEEALEVREIQAGGESLGNILQAGCVAAQSDLDEGEVLQELGGRGIEENEGLQERDETEREDEIEPERLAPITSTFPRTPISKRKRSDLDFLDEFAEDIASRKKRQRSVNFTEEPIELGQEVAETLVPAATASRSKPKTRATVSLESPSLRRKTSKTQRSPGRNKSGPQRTTPTPPRPSVPIMNAPEVPQPLQPSRAIQRRSTRSPAKQHPVSPPVTRSKTRSVVEQSPRLKLQKTKPTTLTPATRTRQILVDQSASKAPQLKRKQPPRKKKSAGGISAASKRFARHDSPLSQSFTAGWRARTSAQHQRPAQIASAIPIHRSIPFPAVPFSRWADTSLGPRRTKFARKFSRELHRARLGFDDGWEERVVEYEGE